MHSVLTPVTTPLYRDLPAFVLQFVASGSGLRSAHKDFVLCGFRVKVVFVFITVTDGAPQTAHDIWEIWTAGASHAGGSFSLGL